MILSFSSGPSTISKIYSSPEHPPALTATFKPYLSLDSFAANSLTFSQAFSDIFIVLRGILLVI